MTITKSATALYVAMVFASGAMVGGLGHKFFSAKTVSASVRPSPDEWRRQYMEEMQSRLKLNGDQVLRVNILLDETRSRVREAHAKSQPEIDQIKKEQVDKVRGLLDEKQKSEYETLRRERDERAKLRKSSGGGL